MAAGLSPRACVRHIEALLDAAEAGADPALLVATLAGDAAVLGRHQHGGTALVAGRVPAPVVRRSGGGRTLRLGAGTAAVALAIPRAAALGGETFAPSRAINRMVRGLLRGLGRLGLPAPPRYTDRDFVAAGEAEIAVVSMDARPGGALLFEAYLGLERTLAPGDGWSGYPPRPGRPARAIGRVDDLAGAIAWGHARAYGCVPEPGGGLGEGGDPDPDPAEPGPSGPLEEVPIGFVHALAGGRVRGDFIAPAFQVRRLEARGEPEPDAPFIGIPDPAPLIRAILSAPRSPT